MPTEKNLLELLDPESRKMIEDAYREVKLINPKTSSEIRFPHFVRMQDRS